MSAVSKRKRRDEARIAMIEQPPDYGPPERWARGEVERHHRADPSDPRRTVSGTRRVMLYDLARRRGTITDAEREAADKWAMLSERAAGASVYRVPGSVVRVPPWQRIPSEMTMRAIAQLRQARAIVGRDGAALLDAWVVEGVSAKALSMLRHESDEAVMGRIRAALGRLAEAWGM